MKIREVTGLLPQGVAVQNSPRRNRGTDNANKWHSPYTLVHAVLSLSVFMTGCNSSALPPIPGTATIAFSSSRPLDGSDTTNTKTFANIWVIDTTNFEAKPLTAFMTGLAVVPVWSPSGEKIAFLSNRGLDGSNSINTNGTFNIWVMNADGSSAHPLTTLTANFNGAGNFAATDVVWSPDGGRLTYDSFRALDGSDSSANPQISNIWIVNIDGSGAAPLTRGTVLGTDSVRAVWSPDGSRIAFTSGRAFDGSDAPNIGRTANIWVMNPDGSGAVPLTRIDASFFAGSDNPAWSSDGRRIAFDSSRALDGSNGSGNASNIWIMNADGSGAISVTKLTIASDSHFPRWSPDGGELAYSSDRFLDGSDSGPFSAFNIWAVNSDGSGSAALTKLTNSGTNIGPAVWMPGASRLAFSSNGALEGSDAVIGTTNIWAVSPKAGPAAPLTKLTAPGTDSNSPVWRQ